MNSVVLVESACCKVNGVRVVWVIDISRPLDHLWLDLTQICYFLSGGRW